MTERVVGLSTDLTKLRQLISQKINTNLDEKKDLVEDKDSEKSGRFIYDLRCQSIYRLSSKEVAFIGDDDNCWYLYIIECEPEETFDLHQIFSDLFQSPFNAEEVDSLDVQEQFNIYHIA